MHQMSPGTGSLCVLGGWGEWVSPPYPKQTESLSQATPDCPVSDTVSENFPQAGGCTCAPPEPSRSSENKDTPLNCFSPAQDRFSGFCNITPHPLLLSNYPKVYWHMIPLLTFLTDYAISTCPHSCCSYTIILSLLCHILTAYAVVWSILQTVSLITCVRDIHISRESEVLRYCMFAIFGLSEILNSVGSMIHSWNQPLITPLH